MELVREGVVSLPRLVALLSTAPAAIMGLPCGLYPGAPADVALLDPEIEFVITLDLFKSRSRNSPFIGRSVRGRAAMTIVGGRIVFE
jgi:dihydroorotase